MPWRGKDHSPHQLKCYFNKEHSNARHQSLLRRIPAWQTSLESGTSARRSQTGATGGGGVQKTQTPINSPGSGSQQRHRPSFWSPRAPNTSTTPVQSPKQKATQTPGENSHFADYFRLQLIPEKNPPSQEGRGGDRRSATASSLRLQGVPAPSFPAPSCAPTNFPCPPHTGTAPSPLPEKKKNKPKTYFQRASNHCDFFSPPPPFVQNSHFWFCSLAARRGRRGGEYSENQNQPVCAAGGALQPSKGALTHSEPRKGHWGPLR